MKQCTAKTLLGAAGLFACAVLNIPVAHGLGISCDGNPPTVLSVPPISVPANPVVGRPIGEPDGYVINAPNGLRWDTYANVTRSNQVRPCDAGNSGLLDAIDRCQMPRDTIGERCDRTACLTPAERGRIRGWIEQGAGAACPGEGCP